MELIIEKEKESILKLKKLIFETGYYVDERNHDLIKFHLYSTNSQYFEFEYHSRNLEGIHEIELEDIATLYSKNIYAALMFFHQEENF